MKKLIVILVVVIILLLVFAFKSYYYIQELKDPERYSWKRLDRYFNKLEKSLYEVNFDSTDINYITLKEEAEGMIQDFEISIKNDIRQTEENNKKRQQYINKLRRWLDKIEQK